MNLSSLNTDSNGGSTASATFGVWKVILPNNNQQVSSRYSHDSFPDQNHQQPDSIEFRKEESYLTLIGVPEMATALTSSGVGAFTYKKDPLMRVLI